MNNSGKTFAKRFWQKVAVKDPSECWEWTAFRYPKGYGHINSGGRGGRTLAAHRAVYEMAFGPIPDGLTIDHLCRNRGCVNPLHLEAVSLEVNLSRSPLNGRGKTHCKHGHEFTDANTLRNDKGWRRCRACGNERARQYYHHLKESNA